MLRVEGISVFYGDIQALWDISLEVEEGEIVSLIGSNGAGKSTTVRTIAGLLHPRRGSIFFQGRPIERRPPHEIVALGISQTPEGRHLFPRMSVVENLELGAYPRHARAERAQSLEHVFQLFPPLEGRRGQLVGTMSGGEQQMVAIGRSLMARPRLLLVDEPSLGLAPQLVEELFRALQAVNRKGVTVLLVEQNVRHALEISNRAYVLESGAIVLQGKGRDLLKEDYVKRAYLGL
jgi:branched-chain amino acid transport system ATP-binding protein